MPRPTVATQFDGPRRGEAEPTPEFSCLDYHCLMFLPSQQKKGSSRPATVLLALGFCFLSACQHAEVTERYPQGNAKCERVYGYFGPKDSLHLKFEKTYFFNGHPEFEIHFRRGQRHGDYADYWHNGQIKSRGKYVAGQREGHWEFFWNRFQLSSQGEYRDNVKTGPWMEYFENGEIRRKGQYREGRETGVWEAFDPHGDTVWVSSCFADNDTGSYRAYHARGAPQEEYGCRKGQPVGTYTRYGLSGGVVLQGHYDSLGRRDSIWLGFHEEGGKASCQGYQAGLWQDSVLAWDSLGRKREQGFFAGGTGILQRFDTAGRTQETVAYRDGLRDGDWVIYFGGGVVKSRSTYARDTLLHIRTFHKNGKPASEGGYGLGLREGLWSRWDDQGRLAEHSQYRAGVLSGEQKFYGPDGKVTQTIRYEHGYPAEGRFRGVPGVEGAAKAGKNPRPGPNLPKTTFEVERR